MPPQLDISLICGLLCSTTFPPTHGSSPASIASFPPLLVITLFALAAQPSLPVRAGPMIAFRLSAAGPPMLSSFTSGSILCSCRPSPLLHLHCLPPETLPFLSSPPASLPPPHLPLPSHTVQVSVMLSRNVIWVAPGQACPRATRSGYSLFPLSP